MRIIQPSFEIIKPANQEEGIAALKFIERMARISHRMEHKQTEDSWEKFIKAVVIDHGDWSVVEHSIVSILLRVDRGFLAEITRHRLCAFTVESTRFVRYGSGHQMEFIKPTEMEDEPFIQICQSAENNYINFLDKKYTPQIARSILPNALATTIGLTTNFRNLRNILLLRTTKEAHPDMRRTMIPLLLEIKNRIPLIFDDIEPEIRQIDNLRKPR